jgi:hypothetical protein
VSATNYDSLVQDVDNRTARAINAFLQQASGIAPMSVEIDRQEVDVQEQAPPRGWLRLRDPPRWVKRTISGHGPGYCILAFSQDNSSLEGPRRINTQHLYVMTDGTMRLHGGYQYGQVRRCGRPGHDEESALDNLEYTAGYGQLPGFLSPISTYTDRGPLIPGLPHDITALQKIAVWLDQQLRSFLTAN